MSYARSPRAVCSTTIGTRFIDVLALIDKSLTVLSLPSCFAVPASTDPHSRLISARLRAEIHDLFERRRLLRDLGALQQIINHLIFEHHRLDLAAGLLILAIRLNRLRRIGILLGEIFDLRLHFPPIELDLRALDHFVDQQADGYAP